MIHRFPDAVVFEGPDGFTDPFRYVPHPLVRLAACLTIERIDADEELSSAFAEGKMLGVLVCRNSRNITIPDGPSATLKFIAAFSGNVGGRSHIEGFVPPIFDLTTPGGHFKTKEAEISSLNSQIDSLEGSEEYSMLRSRVETFERRREDELSQMKKAMAESKETREKVRAGTPSAETLALLIKESQYEKAEFRRRRIDLDMEVSSARDEFEGFAKKIDGLKRLRAELSDKLQNWIFRQYLVHNAEGDCLSIADVFSSSALVPPGGTGECAAPKLLEFAFLNGLEPLAMGEFWYGRSPQTAVRTHGHFYPSCTSKCGPLLGFMMQGLDVRSFDSSDFHGTGDEPLVVFEDKTVVVVEKPSGMPSVPGLDGRKSVQEWLEAGRDIYQVHRLDMDTSGVIVFAKNAEAAALLQRQFEGRDVRKTYMARVGGPKEGGSKGVIEISLSADYDERPRQKVDFKQGKNAHTEYEVVQVNPDGTTDLLLYPLTGRTHQLRVHCAHHLGLGCPIVGDLLYGGHTVWDTASASLASDSVPVVSRLHLHALSISFTHPATGEHLTFSSRQFCY